MLPHKLFLLAMCMCLNQSIILSKSNLSTRKIDEPSYVGSGKCKECHKKIYTGWKSTKHPYKLRPASSEYLKGDFNTNNTFLYNGQLAKMFVKGGTYFMSIEKADKKVKTYAIKYFIGGFWKQQYLTEFPNGELHILPANWIEETQKWQSNDNWGKKIYQKECMGCHTTGYKENYNEKTKSYSQTTWTDFGVGCEACHGAGSNHIMASNRDKTETIINPDKIPDPTLAAMVCGSCHIRGSSVEGGYAYPKNYKPGDHLNFIYNEKPKLHPDDNSKANRQQYIDWKKSTHAKKGVNCWDCHLVHAQGEANKAMTKKPGSSLCLGCHTVHNTGVHGLHSANDCIGCHMPPTGKRATKGDVHSHSFKVIYPKTTMDKGGLEKQPNSCNLCHYHTNDKPEDLHKIIRKIKISGKNRKNFY